MSRFTSHLGLQVLEYSDGRSVCRGDRVLWRLRTPALVWEYGAPGSGEEIVCPAFDDAGMTDEQLAMLGDGRAVADGVTDLGSIPRAFRAFAAPDGPGVKAFCLHDHLYVTQGEFGRYTRQDADNILWEALLAVGAPADTARAIFEAVRLGGGKGWGR